MTTLTTEGVATSDSGYSLQQFLYTIYRGRWLFLSVAACVFLYSAYNTFTTPPFYTAIASFIPPNRSGGVGDAFTSQVTALSGGLLGHGGNAGEEAIALMKSRTVLERMVNRFNLKAFYHVKTETEAEVHLISGTGFSVDPKTGFVLVSFTDGNPNRARDITNAYLDELQLFTAEMALNENTQRRLFYEQKLDQEKTALADAEVALKKNQEATGLVSPGGQTADELQAIAQLRGQISARQVELASLLHNETEQNPDVVRVRRELASLQGQVSQMENGKSGPGGSITRAEVPALTLEFVRLQREVQYHTTLFDILSKQYEAAKLDEAHDSHLQIIDKAVAPELKSGPKRLMMLLSGLALGVLAGLGAVLLRIWWRMFKWNPQPIA